MFLKLFSAIILGVCYFTVFEILEHLPYFIKTPLKYHVFENIVENRAFALLEQMLHFHKVFIT